jgi:flagellar protein FliJ
MSQFAFRLQRVLEYRELEEKWAKDNYLACQSARVQAEKELEDIEHTRIMSLQIGGKDVESRMELELRLSALYHQEELTRRIIFRLLEDEDVARAEWIERKKASGVLEKLREKAFQQWEHAEALKEQAALDEWATQRRKVA